MWSLAKTQGKMLLLNCAPAPSRPPSWCCSRATGGPSLSWMSWSNASWSRWILTSDSHDMILKTIEMKYNQYCKTRPIKIKFCASWWSIGKSHNILIILFWWIPEPTFFLVSYFSQQLWLRHQISSVAAEHSSSTRLESTYRNGGWKESKGKFLWTMSLQNVIGTEYEAAC